jgi:hypothetical protein
MEVWAATGPTVHQAVKEAAGIVWRNSSRVWRINSRGVAAARGVVAEEVKLA